MKYNLEHVYELKSLVHRLFGKDAWMDVKHATDPKIWKKYSNKILDSIAAAARHTVEISDPEWHSELEEIVCSGKKSISSVEEPEEIFASLAASLTKISFHQFGFIPQNTMRKSISLRNRSKWKLNNFRTVQYVQNEEQAWQRQAHNKRVKDDT